jgi:hypothetical protein
VTLPENPANGYVEEERMAALVCSIIEGDPRTAFARVQPAPSIEYWRASSTMSAVKDRSLTMRAAHSASSPENAPLGVNIVQGTDISQDSVCELNQRRFRRVPPAMNDSMLDLDGLSPVSGKAVFARFDGGQLQTVFTQKRLFICSIRVTPWYFRAPGGVASLYLDQGQRVRLESRK